MRLQLRQAVDVLAAGGIVAYPTEAVWGLGCEPLNRHACERLLQMKRRDWRKGVILLADRFATLEAFTRPVPSAVLRRALATWPGPVTWLFPAAAWVPAWLRGRHDRIALRVTAHAPAAALCRAYEGPIVSTSANVAGHPPARTALQVRSWFGNDLDYLLPGPLGGRDRPTTIRDLLTDEVARV